MRERRRAFEYLYVCKVFFFYKDFFSLFFIFARVSHVKLLRNIYCKSIKTKKNILIFSSFKLFENIDKFMFIRENIETIAHASVFASFLTLLNDACWHLKYLSLKFNDVILNIFVILKYRDISLLINIF